MEEKFKRRDVHPFADIFPLMSDAEFDRLVQDIRTNGQLHSITTYRGKIVDGRNREEACFVLGVEPKYEEWSGEGSLVNFIVSVNLHRRNLNESQLGMVAAKIANLRDGQTKQAASTDAPVSQAEAAQLFNVSRKTVQRAKFVTENAIPEVIEQVERGEITVTAAERFAKIPKIKQKRILKKNRNKLKELALKMIVKKAKKTNQETKVVCVICNPEVPETDEAFVVHLAALRQRFPRFARYIDPIITEMSEMELSDPLKEAKVKILEAIDAGLFEKRQIKNKTKIENGLLDGALAYLVEYGDLEILDQNKITEEARGQKKQLYVRPKVIDPNLKAPCVECEQPVGAGYKKLDYESLICKKCQQEEEDLIKKTSKIPFVNPPVAALQKKRDFRQVLGKYGFKDKNGWLLTDYKSFKEVVINEDQFIDPNDFKLTKFSIYKGLKEELLNDE